MRTYPALDVSWPDRPDTDRIGRLLAVIDDDHPVAVEERAGLVRVFFGSGEDRERAASRLARWDATLRSVACDVPDEDWAARSQASLGPVRIGDIVVTPPWAAAEPPAAPTGQSGAVRPLTIVIQPSAGFGTGHHASTRLCLELLQRVPVAGARVADVGTGSGVLALAAWRLGAARVLAIEPDPDALEAARGNIERNGGLETITLQRGRIGRGPALLAPGAYDLILANLTGAFLMRQAGTLARALAPLGRLVASGVLADEATAVGAALAAAGCTVLDRAREDQWVALVAALTSPTAPTAG
jgi:ribosomal protein L11 methyltransferase